MADNRFYYDCIPSEFLQGKILELGAGTGLSQLNSIHAEYFKNERYIGIDKRDDISKEINIIKADFLNIDILPESDTVLMIAVLEHIPISYWSLLKEKMEKTTKRIVLIVPDNEHPKEYLVSDYNTMMQTHKSPHVVFGITRNVLNYFFPNIKVTRIFKPIKWRGKNKFTSLFRFVQCLVTGKFRQRHILLAVWQRS